MTEQQTSEELEARLAKLRAANEAATGWGAAVGARHEEIKGIESELRRRTASHQPISQATALADELLPCPFCGCTAIAEWLGFGTQADIVCEDCGCERAVQVRDVPGCKDAEWNEATYQFDGPTVITVNRYLALEWNERAPASGDVRAAVIEPTDGHGYTGEFTATEFNERAWDHEKAAKNGLSAGPNVSYVRTFQACAVALRYAAKHMFSQSPITDPEDKVHDLALFIGNESRIYAGLEPYEEIKGHGWVSCLRLARALIAAGRIA